MTEFELAKVIGGSPLPESAVDTRRLLETFAGFLNADLPQVGAFHPKVPLSDAVTAAIVVPKGAGPFPVLAYFHGGGWICGSAATHRKLADRFAEAVTLVVNVDYRLAPEHGFPTPLEDCLGAYRWAAREAGRWSGDVARIAVAGDSAGGILAAATAAARRSPDAVGLSLLEGFLERDEGARRARSAMRRAPRVRAQDGDAPASPGGSASACSWSSPCVKRARCSRSATPTRS